MSARRKFGPVIAVAALLLASARVLPSQDTSEFFNAFVDPDTGWCVHCPDRQVGHPGLCPCRLNDPIIIK